MAKKKYNNDSREYADWTTKKLKEEAKIYHDIIYRVECYGTRDIITYDNIINELYNRGIEPKIKLNF